MSLSAIGDVQPAADSMTVQCIVVPGGAASNTICRDPWPAVMTPPDRVQVQLDPAWLTTLAEAPEAPTGTEGGAEMTGSAGVMLTVTATLAALVESQPLAAVTVSAYVVVDAGVASGVQLNGSESPVTGSHEQETPPEPPSCTVSPLQIVAVPVAAAVGRVLTVRPAGDDVIVWPNPSVTTMSYDPVSPATVGLIVRVSVETPEIAPPLLRFAPSLRQR